MPPSDQTSDLADALVKLGVRVGLQAMYVISILALPRRMSPMEALAYILANSMAVAYLIQQCFNRNYDLHNAIDLSDAFLLCCTVLWGLVFNGCMIYGYVKFAYEVLAPRWGVIWRTR